VSHLIDKARKVDRLDEKATLAGVGEHLVGEVGRPLRRRVDVADELPHRGLRRGLRQGEIRIAEDHHQQVVEVVGDSPGQDAETFEFLRLLHPPLEDQALVLGVAPPGAVDRDAPEQGLLARPVDDEHSRLEDRRGRRRRK
jgi:hypothetical protein